MIIYHKELHWVKKAIEHEYVMGGRSMGFTYFAKNAEYDQNEVLVISAIYWLRKIISLLTNNLT